MKSPVPLVNWSIRLTRDEVEEWNDTLRVLRREVDDYNIKKTDIVRVLMELVRTPDIREQVTRALSQRRAS